MWSRDAASKDSDPIRPSEGIKAYALCPVFADTQLVRDSIKLYGKSKIEDLEKDTKVRVMDVSEVGHAFDQRLLGALKVIFSKVQKVSQGFFQKSQNLKMITKIDLKIWMLLGIYSLSIFSDLSITNNGEKLENSGHMAYEYCKQNSPK